MNEVSQIHRDVDSVQIMRWFYSQRMLVEQAWSKMGCRDI